MFKEAGLNKTERTEQLSAIDNKTIPEKDLSPLHLVYLLHFSITKISNRVQNNETELLNCHSLLNLHKIQILAELSFKIKNLFQSNHSSYILRNKENLKLFQDLLKSLSKDCRKENMQYLHTPIIISIFTNISRSVPVLVQDVEFESQTQLQRVFSDFVRNIPKSKIRIEERGSNQDRVTKFEAWLNDLVTREVRPRKVWMHIYLLLHYPIKWEYRKDVNPRPSKTHLIIGNPETGIGSRKPHSSRFRLDVFSREVLKFNRLFKGKFEDCLHWLVGMGTFMKLAFDHKLKIENLKDTTVRQMIDDLERNETSLIVNHSDFQIVKKSLILENLKNLKNKVNLSDVMVQSLGDSEFSNHKLFKQQFNGVYQKFKETIALLKRFGRENSEKLPQFSDVERLIVEDRLTLNYLVFSNSNNHPSTIHYTNAQRTTDITNAEPSFLVDLVALMVQTYNTMIDRYEEAVMSTQTYSETRHSVNPKVSPQLNVFKTGNGNLVSFQAKEINDLLNNTRPVIARRLPSSHKADFEASLISQILRQRFRSNAMKLNMGRVPYLKNSDFLVSDFVHVTNLAESFYHIVPEDHFQIPLQSQLRLSNSDKRIFEELRKIVAHASVNLANLTHPESPLTIRGFCEANNLPLSYLPGKISQEKIKDLYYHYTVYEVKAVEHFISREIKQGRNALLQNLCDSRLRRNDETAILTFLTEHRKEILPITGQPQNAAESEMTFPILLRDALVRFLLRYIKNSNIDALLTSNLRAARFIYEPYYESQEMIEDFYETLNKKNVKTNKVMAVFRIVRRFCVDADSGSTRRGQ